MIHGQICNLEFISFTFLKHIVLWFYIEASLIQSVNIYWICCVLSPQSCLTLCDLMDCSPPNSSVHGDSSGKITEVVCHALLQRIFPTQGSNPGLLHCRQILYHLSYQGSVYIENVLVIGHIMAMTVKNNSRSFTLHPLNIFFFLLERCLLTQNSCLDVELLRTINLQIMWFFSSLS